MTERTPLHEWEQGDDGSWQPRPISRGGIPSAAQDNGGGTGPHEHPEYLEPDEVLAGTDIDITVNPDGTIVVSSLAEGSVAQASYLWESSPMTTDPGFGMVAVDVNNAQLATKVAISAVDSGGTDRQAALALLAPGDLFIVQSQTDPNRSYRYSVIAPPTDEGAWWSIPVKYEIGGSSEPADLNPVTVLLILSGVTTLTDHGGLSGLEDNDHPQYSLTTHVHQAETLVWEYGGTGAVPAIGDVTIQGTGQQTRTLNFHKTDADGFVRNLSALALGDVLIVSDDPSTPPVTAFARYVLVSDVTDMGTYYTMQAERTDSTSSAAPPIGTRLRWTGYLQAPVGTPDEGSPVGAQYTWSDLTTIADPGNGFIRGDTADLGAVTRFAVSKVDTNQIVVEGYGMAEGDVLYLTNGDRTWGTLYEITGLIVAGVWFEIDVTFLRGQTADPPQGEVILVQWTPQSPDVTPDDFLEPKEVLAGTGLVATYTTTTVELALAQQGTANAVYKFMDAITGEPAEGYVRFDTTLIVEATLMYLNDVDANGVNWSWAWAALTVGDEIMVVDQATGSFYRGYIDGPVTDDLVHATIPIVLIAAQGVRPNQDDILNIRVYLGSAESLDHGSLGGLGDDDHPQYAKVSDPGLDEVYYQPDAPTPTPGKASVWVDSDGVASAPPVVTSIPVGGFMHYGGSSVPPEWLLCDGRAVSRTTYAVLFSVIGTTFGPGDGTTTFNLPSMANRFARGNLSPGAVGGSASHSHPGTDWRTGTTDAAPNGTGNGNGAPDGTGSAGSHDHNVPAGGGHSHGISDAGGHTHGGTGGAISSGGAPGDDHTQNYGQQIPHTHSIPSGGTHNHGGTNSQADHNHGRTGDNGGHSHTVPNSVHTHGVPGSSHDHNIPASTSEQNLPPYVGFLPIIYCGV